MDECSGLGIGTGVGSVPEGTAEVDRSEFVGIWSRNFSISDQMIISRLKTYTHKRRRRYQTRCKNSRK